MKTAGDILSALFDEHFVKKARGYSKFFDSWIDITEKNGIAAAADHSRIKDLDRGIILIEMDHPGWKQILQTKQSKLLNDFRIRFPELDITGISLMLGKPESQEEIAKEFTRGHGDTEGTEGETEKEITQRHIEPSVRGAENTEEKEKEEPIAKGYDAIKDDEFREKLIKLGQTIAEKEKGPRINVKNP